SGYRLFVAMQRLIGKRDLLEYGEIVWVQLQCLFHFLYGFLPVALPPLNVAGQNRNSWFVRQRASCHGQLCFSLPVIAIGPIQVMSKGQMRFSRVRTRVTNRPNGCLGQLKAFLTVVEAEEINFVVRCGELIIRVEERRIAGDSLTK